MPQLKRLDSECDKGSINFDDIKTLGECKKKQHEEENKHGHFEEEEEKEKYEEDEEDDDEESGEKRRRGAKRRKERREKHGREQRGERKGKEGEEEEEEGNPFEQSVAVPQGYMGFNWNNLQVARAYSRRMKRGYERHCEDGLREALTSIPNVAYNLGGHTVTITSAWEGGLFEFVSAYISPVCDTPQQLLIAAYRDGEQVHNTTLVLDMSRTIPFRPRWRDIDALSFSSGLISMYGGQKPLGKTIFALDDIVLVGEDEAEVVKREVLAAFKKENERLRSENSDLNQRVEREDKRIEMLEKSFSELKKRIL